MNKIIGLNKKKSILIALNKKKRILNFFISLVKIKSSSGQEKNIATFLIKKLKSLGCITRKDKYGNIIARINGIGLPLVICAHMDTVAAGGKIKPVFKKNKVVSNNGTMLGADSKDSIAAILEMLTIIKEKRLKHRTIEIIFTKEEETISLGVKNLDLSLFSGKECVIADSPGPFGTIILSAPFCFKFDIKIEGRRCHVKEPEKGVNVATIVAEAISSMPLGRIDKFTTSNIAFQFLGLRGLIDETDKTVDGFVKENRNSVPDLGMVFGEVRGAKINKVKKVLREIETAFRKAAVHYGGKILFKVEKLADGYIFDRKDSLVSVVKNIFKEQGVEPKFLNSTGGSDANILNARGIHTVVISSAYQNNHQSSEFLMIDDLVKLADFYLRLATDLSF
jgi:tripeptide aminopeptidase